MARARDTGAIVLAAGASSRMGANKAMLVLGGQPILQRVLGAFAHAGVREMVVVVNKPGAELIAVARRVGARCVENERPEQGMFSSVKVGAAALRPGLKGFFVHPVDMPLVLPTTLRRLCAALVPGVCVVHPTFKGRRGHPPLLDVSLIAAIEAFDGSGGLRRLLSAYERHSRSVECGDQGVLIDIDTPEDLRRAQAIALQIDSGMVPRLRASSSKDT